MRSTGVAPDASSWLFDNLSFMASLLAKVEGMTVEGQKSPSRM
jgi:hypothetical protein